MSGGKRGLALGLVVGLAVGGVLFVTGDRAHDVQSVGEAAVEAFRSGQFEAFQPYTPAGLSSEGRLRLMCGAGPIPADCQARHEKAMTGSASELARFQAAFDESVARAKAAGFDWTDAAMVSVDVSGITPTPGGHDTGVEASGRLMVHGRSPAGGGFVLELTGCARITWQGWLCAIPRWRPSTTGEGVTP